MHDRLLEVGKPALIAVLDKIQQQGRLSGEKQNNELANYAHKLKKEEGAINWNQSNGQILRHIRGLNPWPVAHS